LVASRVARALLAFAVRTACGNAAGADAAASVVAAASFFEHIATYERLYRALLGNQDCPFGLASVLADQVVNTYYFSAA
jgi:hypothetical protein